MFFDLYGIDETFPLYFAIIALGLGIASYLNSQLVMRYGMHRLEVFALVGLVVFSAALLGTAMAFDGVPPFGAFMTPCFLSFCCKGVLFGNVNALEIGRASCRDRVGTYV